MDFEKVWILEKRVSFRQPDFSKVDFGQKNLAGKLDEVLLGKSPLFSICGIPSNFHQTELYTLHFQIGLFKKVLFCRSYYRPDLDIADVVWDILEGGGRYTPDHVRRYGRAVLSADRRELMRAIIVATGFHPPSVHTHIEYFLFTSLWYKASCNSDVAFMRFLLFDLGRAFIDTPTAHTLLCSHFAVNFGGKDYRWFRVFAEIGYGDIEDESHARYFSFSDIYNANGILAAFSRELHLADFARLFCVDVGCVSLSMLQSKCASVLDMCKEQLRSSVIFVTWDIMMDYAIKTHLVEYATALLAAQSETERDAIEFDYDFTRWDRATVIRELEWDTYVDAVLNKCKFTGSDNVDDWMREWKDVIDNSSDILLFPQEYPKHFCTGILKHLFDPCRARSHKLTM